MSEPGMTPEIMKLVNDLQAEMTKVLVEHADAISEHVPIREAITCVACQCLMAGAGFMISASDRVQSAAASNAIADKIVELVYEQRSQGEMN
tara:strand:- start:299 stop:574 length:276 start_codon:yes stop_codon:yes gene_type:complete